MRLRHADASDSDLPTGGSGGLSGGGPPTTAPGARGASRSASCAALPRLLPRSVRRSALSFHRPLGPPHDQSGRIGERHPYILRQVRVVSRRGDVRTTPKTRPGRNLPIACSRRGPAPLDDDGPGGPMTPRGYRTRRRGGWPIGPGVVGGPSNPATSGCLGYALQICLLRAVAAPPRGVIASAAKQSRRWRGPLLDCFVAPLLTMRHGGLSQR
jgi:hypothetical protein